MNKINKKDIERMIRMGLLVRVPVTKHVFHDPGECIICDIEDLYHEALHWLKSKIWKEKE